MASGRGVLDVAGGQSGLAWELINYDRVPATVVDPRPSVRARRFERRYAHRRRQEEDGEAVEAEAPRHWPVYWRDEVWRPVRHGEPSADALAALTAALSEKPPHANSARRTRKGYFEETRQSDDGDEASADITAISPPPPPPAEEAWATLRDCSMVVGMHPDSATESIVDFALQHGKPFAVVPCCVCAVDFPNRKMQPLRQRPPALQQRGPPTTKADAEYLAFVDHLVAKAPERIGVTMLGFEGRNLCIYSLPPATSMPPEDGDTCCEACEIALN